MKALLDTCTFLWLAFDPGRISPDAREVLDDPGTAPGLRVRARISWPICWSRFWLLPRREKGA